ncbi:MAG TPA: hypothetical protein VF798_15185 [Burkholderiaceae bacterium]
MSFAALLLFAFDAGATPLTIVGTYHCSSDGCGWNSARSMTGFDTQNPWLIGRGISYASNWDSALAANAAQLGINAANLAKTLGVGIEIDYENGTPPPA